MQTKLSVSCESSLQDGWWHFYEIIYRGFSVLLVIFSWFEKWKRMNRFFLRIFPQDSILLLLLKTNLCLCCCSSKSCERSVMRGCNYKDEWSVFLAGWLLWFSCHSHFSSTMMIMMMKLCYRKLYLGNRNTLRLE